MVVRSGSQRSGSSIASPDKREGRGGERAVSRERQPHTISSRNEWAGAASGPTLSTSTSLQEVLDNLLTLLTSSWSAFDPLTRLASKEGLMSRAVLV